MVEPCIWCPSQQGNSLEHVAPEALGCPPEFVLTSGVCLRCNNKNGGLDRALLLPFEFMTVVKGILRKKGKLPTIDGYASLASSYDDNGPALYINRERHKILAPNGKWLRGTSATDPITSFDTQPNADGTVEIKLQQQLRFDRKAVRGLFKIAIETVAFFEGVEAAKATELADARDFVTKGRGQFRSIIMLDQNPSYESYFAPSCSKDGFARVCGMTILGIGFLCDFDPNFRGGNMLLAEMCKQGIAGQVIPNWPRSLWVQNNPPKMS